MIKASNTISVSYFSLHHRESDTIRLLRSAADTLEHRGLDAQVLKFENGFDDHGYWETVDIYAVEKTA